MIEVSACAIDTVSTPIAGDVLCDEMARRDVKICEEEKKYNCLLAQLSSVYLECNMSPSLALERAHDTISLRTTLETLKDE